MTGSSNKASVDRRLFIGGSDARIMMSADEAALIRLWREKRGETEPEDLSGNLIVQLGVATEPLNRNWYERNTGGRIADVQRRVHHPVNRWMAATLDGMVEDRDAVFEAKLLKRPETISRPRRFTSSTVMFPAPKLQMLDRRWECRFWRVASFHGHPQSHKSLAAAAYHFSFQTLLDQSRRASPNRRQLRPHSLSLRPRILGWSL